MSIPPGRIVLILADFRILSHNDLIAIVLYGFQVFAVCFLDIRTSKYIVMLRFVFEKQIFVDSLYLLAKDHGQ